MVTQTLTFSVHRHVCVFGIQTRLAPATHKYILITFACETQHVSI